MDRSRLSYLQRSAREADVARPAKCVHTTGDVRCLQIRSSLLPRLRADWMLAAGCSTGAACLPLHPVLGHILPGIDGLHPAALFSFHLFLYLQVCVTLNDFFPSTFWGPVLGFFV